MKFSKFLLLVMFFILSSNVYSQSATNWTDEKSLRAVQLQTPNQAVYLWTTGSWFPTGHRCEEKTVVLLKPSGDQNAFDQVYSQVLLAQATGKPIKFLTYTDDCDALPNGNPAENPYYRAQFVNVQQ